MPPFEASEWADCHALNAAGGIDMLEWQDGIMRCWLARNALGRWAAPTCAGSVPRQNGKSLGLVVPRANYGMTVLGEQVIYTSHLQKTSTETFESVAAFFDSRPLRKYVKDIKTALGREQVVLKNGGRMKFLARTRNGGRGQHGDLLIFDEALELDSDSQSSFLPAISASANPQVVYVSSPPTAASAGTVLRDIRARALSGASERTCWFEWSVDEVGDVRDKARWYAANPSMGVLIHESTVEGECEQMDADAFARERLGWWPPVDRAERCIDAGAWDECATDAPGEPTDAAYGVKFSPDGSEVILAVAERVDGGRVHVEVLAAEPMGKGTAWLASWLMERTAAGRCAVVDGRSGAPALLDRLEAAPRGFAVAPRAGDATAAASMLVDAVNARSLTWYSEQARLAESAKSAVRRRIGAEGGWGFGGADPAPIEACALALWGLETSKRDPRRKLRIGW